MVFFFMIGLLLLTLLFVGGKTGLTTFISAVLNSSTLFSRFGSIENTHRFH
ncbi:MAG TPA: hypothetical protein PLN65_02850 [Enterococcus sp.]|nr:hypothetical protein [Enterococcus sp.]